MPEVQVSVEDGLEAAVSAERVEAVVRHVLRARGVEEAEISVALLGDAAITALNREYLGHDGPTDAISFSLGETGEPPLGDVYIGVEQALRQAPTFGATPQEEVLRLAVHGTLHVLGFDHPEGEDRAGSEMFQVQEALLREFLARG